ncbi:MAG: hypothetical protein ACP5DQ_05100, partial [Bacteroidales bacterium]
RNVFSKPTSVSIWNIIKFWLKENQQTLMRYYFYAKKQSLNKRKKAPPIKGEPFLHFQQNAG